MLVNYDELINALTALFSAAGVSLTLFTRSSGEEEVLVDQNSTTQIFSSEPSLYEAGCSRDFITQSIFIFTHI